MPTRSRRSDSSDTSSLTSNDSFSSIEEAIIKNPNRKTRKRTSRRSDSSDTSNESSISGVSSSSKSSTTKKNKEKTKEKKERRQKKEEAAERQRILELENNPLLENFKRFNYELLPKKAETIRILSILHFINQKYKDIYVIERSTGIIYKLKIKMDKDNFKLVVVPNTNDWRRSLECFGLCDKVSHSFSNYLDLTKDYDVYVPQFSDDGKYKSFFDKDGHLIDEYRLELKKEYDRRGGSGRMTRRIQKNNRQHSQRRKGTNM